MTEETTTHDEISGDNTPVAAGDEHANAQPEPAAITAAPDPPSRSDSNALLFEVLLVLVLLFGCYLRIVGLNWDENQHLHPDERFLTMVESSLTPIEQPADYFDTANSTLNPHNTGHGFFVYGTVPIFITRYTAEGIKTIKQDWLESEVPWQQTLATWAAGTDDAPGLLAQFGTDFNQVHLVGLVDAGSDHGRTVEELYQSLLDEGIEVLYDDRRESAGVKFKDADLIGVPLRITAGARSLDKGEVEIKRRTVRERTNIPLTEALTTVRNELAALQEEIDRRVVEMPYTEEEEA